MREIIIHCFQWSLKDITKNLSEIKDCGYTAIQVSPVNEVKAGKEWWTYYQPLSFKIGNKSGTKEDLIELCSKANEMGIKVIVDVVLRHCANKGGGKLANVPHDDVDNTLKENKNFWTNSANITNYDNRDEVTNGSMQLPMLNYNNHDLQDIYIEFLQELKDLGVAGYRVDMCKHLSLPSEGSDFWTRVFRRFSDMFNYGECINSSRELLDQYTPYIKTLSETDTTNKSDSVVFFMTHDTDLNDGGITKNMTDEMIIKEWNFLLNDYKESSVLFYCRPFSGLWRNESIKMSNLTT